MKKYKKMLIILFFFFTLIFLTGCTQNTNEELKTKVISELDYANIKTVNLLNKLNDISYDNYSIVSEQVKSNEEKGQSQSTEGNQDADQGGQSGQSESGSSGGGGSGGSSDTKGSEEKQEKEGESQDSVNTTMVTDSELNKNRDNINWENIKKEIELLNESWSVIILDLYALDVKNDTILSFSDKLNASMIAVKSENKEQSLTALADLYSNIPRFLEEINADKNMQKIRKTQSYVINAYVLADDMENTLISDNINNAVETYSEIMTDIDYVKDKTQKTNKIYVLLNEMANSIDERDSDIFYIKYKNFMKEIETI